MSRRRSEESLKQTISADEQRPGTYLFMVRVWQEDLGGGKTEWRGQVKYVLSGEVRYFREWAQLVKYLKAALSQAKSLGSDQEGV